MITDKGDIENLKKLTTYNIDHPTNNFFVEFQEIALSQRQSQKNGGIKKIMTPTFKSRRLSRSKGSVADEENEDQLISNGCNLLS